MKTLKKSILLLTSLVVAVSAASCVNDELTEPEEGKRVKELATIDEQAASMEATLVDLEALQTVVEGREEEIASAVSSIEEHIADLKAGASLLEGTKATLAQQKMLAGLVGSIEAGVEPTKAETLTKAVTSIDKGAGEWLGKHFSAYYSAVKAEAMAKARIASFDLKSDKILVEGVLSDVEAGLRKEFDTKELAALAAGIEGNEEEAEELLATLSAMTTEVETGYTEAVETAVDTPEDFDLPALKQLNSAVIETLSEADNSLSGLIARVKEFEAQIEDLKSRISALESEIADLNELLDMIQSVTFMSEYSAENAIAYYTLGSESRADGKKLRNPEGTIDLNYIVRPASAAQALTVSDLWDNEVKVFGYYAQTITKAVPDMFDFDITSVTADSGSGIVTVSVSSSNLKDSFYFKETGAKLALSIATDKTDLTSKFVEIVPKDRSGAVYVEEVRLSTEYIEIDNGQTANLAVTLTPDKITTDGVVWRSSDTNVAFVSSDGVITAKSVGTAVITVTTNSTDEWGNQLTATCNVKVNPAIKLKGPGTVTENGGTAELMLTLPENYPYNNITWSSSNNLWATVDENGVVTGVTSILKEDKQTQMVPDGQDGYIEQEIVLRRYYCEVTIECDIDGTKLTHKMQVVKVQPTAISIEGRNFNENTITMKTGTEYTLGEVSVYPANVDKNCFSISAYATMNSGISYDADTRKIKANYPGYSTISFSYSATHSEYWLSYQRPGRVLEVIVEPYWVETVSLPSAFEMNVDQTASLTPTFTSEVEGKAPTYTDLTWTSSNPSIVSINSTTGEMTSHEEGTVIITATTSHANAVPSGQPQKSATCAVTVKKPTAPITIGDYYYSDGTWGSDANPSGKSVIGVIFSTVNAVASDNHLRNDYPKCSNGLVVSTVEYTSTAVTVKNWSYVDAGAWCKNNGYSSYNDQSNPCGYTNTKGYLALNGANVSSYGYVIDFTLFNSSSPVVTHRNNVAVPETASAWYVPSYKEMQLLYENREAVNNSINAVSGNPLHIARANYDDYMYQYWISTFNLDDKIVQAFNMTNGQWYGSKTEGTSLPVRVILAF